MVGIRGSAVAQDFTINPSAAVPGLFQGFQDQYPGPLAQREPLPLPVKRSAGLRIHRFQGVKSGKGQLGQRFAAAGCGQIHPSLLDPIEAQADGRNRRRTGRIDSGPGSG